MATRITYLIVIGYAVKMECCQARMIDMKLRYPVEVVDTLENDSEWFESWKCGKCGMPECLFK